MTNGIEKSYKEPYGSNPTVTLYSIATAPISTNSIDNEPSISKLPSINRRISQPSSTRDESKTIHGGLCGLQNLGNTVKISNKIILKIFFFL